MKIFKNFFKPKNKIVKSFSSIFYNDYGANSYFSDYYDFYFKLLFQASPLGNGLELITEHAKSIKIILQNQNDGKITYRHPILDLIKSNETLVENMITNKIITGNIFVEVVGNTFVDEIKVINSNKVSYEVDADEDRIEILRVNKGTRLKTYKYDEEIGGYRSDAGFSTIYHWKNFNPFENSVIGKSEIANLTLEIQSYIFANIHNLSLLKNGARPTGMLKIGGVTLTSDEQFAAYTKQVREQMRGAENAGTVPIISADIMDYVDFSKNMTDMDFSKMLDKNEQRIYKALNIPMALISGENMTYSNLQEATYLLYINAVLPNLRTILNFLSKILLSRFKVNENFSLSFDETEIETIKERKIKAVLEMSKTNALTLNELRELLFFQPIKDGDKLMIEYTGQKQAQDLTKTLSDDELILKSIIECRD